MPATYSGNSIVDYLKSVDQDSSYGNRANLYASANLNMGQYAGTAQQNLGLLSYLRGNQSQSQPTPQPSPSPQPNNTVTPTQTSTQSNYGTPRVDYVEKLTENLMNEKGKYDSNVDAARAKLLEYYNNLEPITDRYENLRQEQGVSQQEELVNTLARMVMDQTDLVEAVPDSVTQRAGDFFINDADRVAMTAREQQPLMESLTKLLRNKEREEIGLAGKQNLVRELLQLSLQDDERRARPLEMGVDYSEADRAAAMDLLGSITNSKISAFSDDRSSRDAIDRQQEQFRQQLEMFNKEVSSEKEMEQIRQQNRIALENLQTSNSRSSKQEDQKTEDAWNSILGSAQTEYDVWKAIDQNQDKLRSQGIDVNKLWSKHSALAADVGTGGAIRNSSEQLSAEELVRILGG